MQINAFGPHCDAGGQPLYELIQLYTHAVQRLHQLQFSAVPLVPFSPTWCAHCLSSPCLWSLENPRRPSACRGNISCRAADLQASATA